MTQSQMGSFVGWWRLAQWWVLLILISVGLIWVSPLGPHSSPFQISHVLWMTHLFFPFLIYTWVQIGFLWGFGLTGFSIFLTFLVTLATREWFLFFIPLELAALAWVTYLGLGRWQVTKQTLAAQEERLRENLNVLALQTAHLQEIKEAYANRLRRYQRLKQVATTFSTTFNPEELISEIVQVTGELVENSSLVLLYGIGNQLSLELKAVWRRLGNVTVKAKAGDAFDLWVMRQAQSILVEDAAHDFRFPKDRAQELGRSMGSLLIVPLASENRFLGVLRVESSGPKGLTQEDLRLVRIIGDLASLAIENAGLYQRMEELSITDDLTGLNLRRYFEKRLEEEIDFRSPSGAPFSVLFIDIDRFKEYNDAFGHSAGDKLLKHIARLLLQAHRSGEVVARFGGEEFACLLPGMTQETASQRAEFIRRQVELSQISLRRTPTFTTVSVGVASFPEDGKSSTELLKKADERLYQAKAQGRNQVCAI